MKIPRQGERWARFQVAFQKMPLWETWSEQRNKLTEAEYFNACREAGEVLERETRTVNHCKSIPRRVRRSMARDLAKREYQAARA